jgi:hypothetical protein
MNANPRVQTLLKRINLPPQDMERLTFCRGSKPAKVEAWVNTLPLTRVNHVSGMLYKALPEIVRLKTSASNRLEMLESLRPAAQHCIQTLSRSYLNQPLILPEAAVKTATIAQALQKHMTNAYLVAARDIILTGQRDNPVHQDQQALAIHRALTGLGLLLLRSCQLYTPTPSRFWDEIHSLYLLAEMLDVHHRPVRDSLPHHGLLDTPEKVYLRLLLLACARPNQLRQDEVSDAYAALNQLAPLARIMPFNPAQNESLFAVMLDTNLPPLYKSRLPDSTDGEIRELNTSWLTETLQAETTPEASIEGTTHNRYGLTAALNQHLFSAWKIQAQRAFERHGAQGQVELTIGLTNLHFHLCGGLPFNLFLNQEDDIYVDSRDQVFQRRDGTQKDKADALAGKLSPGFQPENSISEDQREKYASQHTTHFVPVIDISPGGYCLEWRSEIPPQVKAGEILGIREENRSKWSIGVVRWVQQTRGATQLGIHVLAHQAIPMGTAIVYNTGGHSDYLRGLQIPALKAINQPETLITNTVSFKEYGKVRLYQPAGDRTVQLTSRLFSTGAVSQFAFRELVADKADSDDQEADDLGSNEAEDPQDFDSIWDD